MPSVTNKGLFRALESFVTNGGNYNLALITEGISSVTADINTLGELTEIAAGNGYDAGGKAITNNGTFWDVVTEDDTGNTAFAQLVAQVWTASGGPIPASGGDALTMVLTDNNATIGSREVLFAFDLVSGRSVSDGQPLTVDNAQLNFDR